MYKINLPRLLATWFGFGLSPKAPGTAGSLAALPFAWVIQAYVGSAGLFVAAIAVFFLGWWASASYLRASADQADNDPKEVVIDEVAGQWLLLAALTIPSGPPSWFSYLIGFLLFRFFDIVKPWPVSLADRKVKGALGIMLDDIVAALYPLVLAMIAGFLLTMMGVQL